MKRVFKVVLMMVLMVMLLPITNVKAAASSWTISYDVVWDGSVYKLDNVAVNMGGETAVSATLTLPSSITLASETAGAGWTNRAEASGSISYLTPTNNTEADFVTYLESLTFNGTYGTSTGNISFQIFEAQMSSWVDPNGFVHYYEFVSTDPNNVTWDVAYNNAKGMSYRGLTGFLATITSQEEHNYIYNSIATNPGWLGGTRYVKLSDGSKFVNEASITGATDIDTDITHGTKWYWTCGCAEAGTEFYATPTWDPAQGSASAPNATPYYNWFSASATQHEPNNSQWAPAGAPTPEPEGALQFAEDHSDLWNDILWSNVNSLQNQGYYVEFTNDSACGETMTPADAMFTAALPMPATPAPTPAPTPGPFLVTFLDCQGNTIKIEWVSYKGGSSAPGGYGLSDVGNVTTDVVVSPSNCGAINGSNGYKVPNTAVK